MNRMLKGTVQWGDYLTNFSRSFPHCLTLSYIYISVILTSGTRFPSSQDKKDWAAETKETEFGCPGTISACTPLSQQSPFSSICPCQVPNAPPLSPTSAHLSRLIFTEERAPSIWRSDVTCTETTVYSEKPVLKASNSCLSLGFPQNRKKFQTGVGLS